MQQFSQIWLRWGNEIESTRLTMHDTTLEDAIGRAKFFGYREPKWYQFWLNKIEVVTTPKLTPK